MSKENSDSIFILVLLVAALAMVVFYKPLTAPIAQPIPPSAGNSKLPVMATPSTVTAPTAPKSPAVPLPKSSTFLGLDPGVVKGVLKSHPVDPTIFGYGPNPPQFDGGLTGFEDDMGGDGR